MVEQRRRRNLDDCGWAVGDAWLDLVLAEALGLLISVAVTASRNGWGRTAARRAPSAEPGDVDVYARELVGYALSIGGQVHSAGQRAGHHRPRRPRSPSCSAVAGSCSPLVSDEAVLIAARIGPDHPGGGSGVDNDGGAAGGPARQPAGASPSAERARVLGEAVALLRDMLNPDDLVVGGQAFTEYPEGMDLVEAAFNERSVLAPRDIRVTAFGNRVQEAGAGWSRSAGFMPIRSARCGARRPAVPKSAPRRG